MVLYGENSADNANQLVFVAITDFLSKLTSVNLGTQERFKIEPQWNNIDFFRFGNAVVDQILLHLIAHGHEPIAKPSKPSLHPAHQPTLHGTVVPVQNVAVKSVNNYRYPGEASSKT